MDSRDFTKFLALSKISLIIEIETMNNNNVNTAIVNEVNDNDNDEVVVKDSCGESALDEIDSSSGKEGLSMMMGEEDATKALISQGSLESKSPFCLL